MPLLKCITLSPRTQVWVWKITEAYPELFASVSLKEQSLVRVDNMKSEGHRKGFLSVRRLLAEAGYSDFDLYYDPFGKPHLTDCKHISISHSHDFSVIVISDRNVGADLEILKEKTLKLAPRFMDVSHLEGLNETDSLTKSTVVWGVKESVFKIKNEVGISFKDHIFEDNFDLTEKKCKVTLRYDGRAEYFDIVFDFIENYVFVCAFEAK